MAALEKEVMDSNDRFVREFARPITDMGYGLTGAVSTCNQYDPDGDESYCHVALISPLQRKNKDDNLLLLIRDVILPKEFEDKRVFMRYLDFNPNENPHKLSL
ncbi:MAG: hypothetical protein QME12_06820 [Nanoarchaeota archaeon]|nr:hypothetical protein [Nanoarchaeota archaeon]